MLHVLRERVSRKRLIKRNAQLFLADYNRLEEIDKNNHPNKADLQRADLGWT